MVTIKTWGGKPNANTSEIYGLSTDEKPINMYGNIKIKNSSTFYCMDTKEVYMYDEDNKIWILQ